MDLHCALLLTSCVVFSFMQWSIEGAAPALVPGAGSTERGAALSRLFAAPWRESAAHGGAAALTRPTR